MRIPHDDQNFDGGGTGAGKEDHGVIQGGQGAPLAVMGGGSGVGPGGGHSGNGGGSGTDKSRMSGGAQNFSLFLEAVL